MKRRDLSLRPGDVIADTYEIVKTMAMGGMGTLFEARHQRLRERKVVVKVLTAISEESGEFLPRFRREAEIGASLHHPNIVAVTDWNVLEDGSPFFVMEFLDGEDLGERMGRGRIPLAEIVHIIDCIGSALTAAHRQGIVHRDLKPNNVFLERVDDPRQMPRVKVLDFGISKVLFAETLQTTSPKLLGTPRYMSPEQARGRNSEIDARADQFGLATIAYELLAGKPAFQADTLESVLYNIVHEPPEPLSEIAPELSAHLIAAVQRGMAKNPGDRFPTVEDFLDGFHDREPSSRAAPGARRVLTLAAVAAGAAVVAALVIGLAFRGNGDQAPPAVPETATPGTPPSETTPGPTKPGMPMPAMPADETRPTDRPRTKGATGATTREPKAPKSPPTQPGPAPKERPEVASRLDRAQARLNVGEYRETIRLARQALGLQDVQRAYRLLTISYCGLADLGGAKAAFFKVADRDRAEVRSACADSEIDL